MIRFIIALVVLASFNADVFGIDARGPGFEVGQTVVVIHEAELNDEKGIVGKVRPGQNVKIQAIDGNRLQVSSSGLGWLDRHNVVDIEKGILLLDAMIKHSPRDPKLYYRRGSIWLVKKEYEKAIGDLNESVRLRPHEFYFAKRGKILSEKGEHDKALADFDEAIRLDSLDAETFSHRGSVWYAKQDWDKALVDFDQAIRLDPKEASYYYNRGIARVQKNDNDGAIADFNDSIRLNPNSASTYCCRGRAWSQKSENKKAIADYDEAIRLDPTNVSLFYNRGNIWTEERDFDKAMGDYNEAIRLDPNDGEFYVCRGTIWSWKGDYDRTIADFDEAIRLEPKSPHGYNSLAWFYWPPAPTANSEMEKRPWNMQPKPVNSLNGRKQRSWIPWLPHTLKVVIGIAPSNGKTK